MVGIGIMHSFKPILVVGLPLMVVGFIMTTLALADRPAANAQPAADGTEIINAKSYFRWRRVTAPLTFAEASGPVAAPKDAVNNKPPLSPDPEAVQPPANWTDGAFDDSAWPRVRPGAPNVTDGEAMTLGAFRVCIRGRFEVTDPAALRALDLAELRFSGGVIVYLNGREVARGFMADGKLEPSTPANAYDDDAWLTAEGHAIPEDRSHVAKDAAADIAARADKRIRRLALVHLPADAIHKGVNVLAIDLRRSPSHPKAFHQWQPIALDLASISLRATGGGITPNTSRPQGFHVWVEDINDRITERDWADPCEPIGPMHFVGARNGSFGGMLVLSSTSPLANIKATMSDLKAVKGDAAISSSAVELFTARLDGHVGGRTGWFDGLAPGMVSEAPVLQITAWQQAPVNDAAVLPVYLRLNIPRTALPGDYRGSITISAGGAQPVIVPVQAYVSNWVVPDPRDYRTYVGLYQSPTSVAMQYKVKEWSEEHWKLLDKSFALLARAGNKMVNLCVVDQTQFGNDEGMLYWIRKADGTYDYDFTVFDRFVELAKKHWGTLDYVALQVWHSGGWEMRGADQTNTVTVVDAATHQRQHMQVPKFDSDEARAFWKPALAACRQHLAKAGLEKAMCIGILSDGTAPSGVFKMFDDVWPGGGPALWTRGLHGQREDTKPYRPDRGGGLVVLHEHCYGSPMLTVGDALTGLSTLRGVPVTAYFRYSGFETLCNVYGYRMLTDNAIFLRKQGIGRIGFDFWDVMPDRHGDEGQTIYNRYPFSSCAQRAPALYKLSWPGPDGAQPTQRFEVLCQGIQETEGMLAISAALDKPAAALDKDTAERYRKVLYDRLWFLNTRPSTSVRWATMENHVNYFDWQNLARETFDCAAQAAGPVH